jgi:hypothetical protein
MKEKQICECGNWFRGNSDKCIACNTAIIMKAQQQINERIINQGGKLIDLLTELKDECDKQPKTTVIELKLKTSNLIPEEYILELLEEFESALNRMNEWHTDFNLMQFTSRIK